MRDYVTENLDLIRGMGKRAIAKAHALGLSAYVSRRPGEITELRPDGTEVTIRVEDEKKGGQ